MTQRHPLVVDVDPGIDDAAALAYLHALGAWQLVAATSVAGNVTGEIAFRNAGSVLRLLDLDLDVPLHRGADRPLAVSRHDADYGFGADGLGGVPVPASRAAVLSESAAEALVRLAREHEGELEVIALGPLTNIAMATLLDPLLPQRVASLTIMGGALSERGNVTPSAEFNFFGDPHAASMVLSAGFRYTLVGLDVTQYASFEAGDRARLRESSAPATRALGDMLDRFLQECIVNRGRTSCPLHDPLAVAVAHDRRWVALEQGKALVETESPLTRGESLWWPDGATSLSLAKTLAGTPVGCAATCLRSPREFVDHFCDQLLRLK